MDKYKEIITKERTRIAEAAVARHLRKTGSDKLIVNMNDGTKRILMLDAGIVCSLLKNFENTCDAEFGFEGKKVAAESYQKSIVVNSRGEFLTEIGKTLIDECVEDMVNYARENPGVFKDGK